MTALLITAGVKLHPAAGYKSCLSDRQQPGFNRRLSGGQPAAWSEGTGSPVVAAIGPLFSRLKAAVSAMYDEYEYGLSTKWPVSLLLLSIHPSTRSPTGNTKIIATASPRGNQGFSEHWWPRGHGVGRLRILMGAPTPLQSTICSALSLLWQGSGRGCWKENK